MARNLLIVGVIVAGVLAFLWWRRNNAGPSSDLPQFTASQLRAMANFRAGGGRELWRIQDQDQA